MTPEVKERIDQFQHGNVPEGYTQIRLGIVPVEWTDACLGDIYTERKESGNEDLPLLMVSIHSGVSDGEVDEDDLPKKVKRIEDKSQYKRAAKGDLVFNMMRAWQGAIGTVRTEGMVSPAYIVAEPNELIDPLFMDYYMKTNRMVHTLYRQSYGVTDFRLRLYWDSFAPIQCVLPSVKEQKKIAEILTTQDKVIELEGRKIEEIKKAKQFFLNKMFPKKGQSVPEIRFKGFTDAWEQRKLGDILQTLPFKAYLKSPEQDGRYEIIQQGSDPIIGYANGEPCRDYKNTVIFGDHTLSLYKPKKPFFVATDGVRIVKGSEKMDGNYLLPLLERNKPQSEGYKRYYSILADIDVFFTENHKEQSKIGEYFSELDHLITLHQRKLEEEKKKKKALMQLLLTGIVRV
ncbi:MAG: restriction endonuclease subunit S [Candidatus Faecousia sp.]|uniref:restriction endonuclease subunit S n=1 Tax=Faecousia sp. TaxID=2952921 RepID=UPI002A84DF5E|nr:restriction endonuclease subunit S [Candidatus Faecousia sp.]